MRVLGILLCALLAALCAAGNVQGEISEQFHVVMDRQGSCVFHVQRAVGGYFYIQTGHWTHRHSPGRILGSPDTTVTFFELWLAGVPAFHVDTPEEGWLIANLSLYGPPLVAPSMMPIDSTIRIRTGVRITSLSEVYETECPDSAVAKFDLWIDGEWDIDRGNEREFVRDTMRYAP